MNGPQLGVAGSSLRLLQRFPSPGWQVPAAHHRKPSCGMHHPMRRGPVVAIPAAPRSVVDGSGWRTRTRWRKPCSVAPNSGRQLVGGFTCHPPINFTLLTCVAILIFYFAWHAPTHRRPKALAKSKTPSAPTSATPCRMEVTLIWSESFRRSTRSAFRSTTMKCCSSFSTRQVNYGSN